MTRFLFGFLAIAGVAAVGAVFKIGELSRLKSGAQFWDVATFFAACVIAMLTGALVWEVGRAIAPRERRP